MTDTSKFRVLYLKTGEHVLCSLPLDTAIVDPFLGDCLFVHRPIKAVTALHEDAARIMLLRWNPYTSDELVKIPTREIMTISTMDKETADYYLAGIKQQVSYDAGEPVETLFFGEDEPLEEEEEKPKIKKVVH